MRRSGTALVDLGAIFALTSVMGRILEHLGLPNSLPEIAPARAPPEAELPFTGC